VSSSTTKQHDRRGESREAQGSARFEAEEVSHYDKVSDLP